MAIQLTDTLRKKYDFRWEVLDVIVGGRSLIDSDLGLTGFPMRTIDDSDRFMRSYGYNLDDPIEYAEAQGNFHEAINFVRKHFLQPENPDGIKTEIPRKILELADVRELLLMASLSYPGQMEDTEGKLLRDWACCLLKIIHTIAHMDKDIRSTYFTDIQKQILDRFYKVVHRDPDGKLYLGETPDDRFRVELVAFETKPKKSRESVLLKLLHKPENVAEDIFDRVGIRFVTHTMIDALRVVKYLKDAMILVPANVKPSRSRNTLVDLDRLRRGLGGLLAKADRGEINEDGLRMELESIARPRDDTPPVAAVNAPNSTPADGAGSEDSSPEGDEPDLQDAPAYVAAADGGTEVTTTDNPHSSKYYRAIQFTSRQLIKLRNPLYEELKALKALSKTTVLPEEVASRINRVNLKYIQREVRFFYPFEIQVVDKAAHEENEKGRSAHSEYKKAQIQSALKRVMGPVADGIR